jgi:hypothetical protein
MFLAAISYSEWSTIIGVLIGLQGVVMNFWPPPTKKHPQTKRRKYGKWIYLSISAALGISVIIFAHLQEDKRVHEQAQNKREYEQSKSQLTNEIAKLEARIGYLITDLSTNQALPATTKLQILDDLNSDIFKEGQSIQTEILKMHGHVDLPLLITERQNQRAIWTIKQQESDIKANEAEDQSKLEEAEKAQKETQQEKLKTKNCLPIFDYAITRLFSMLSDIQNQTGLEMRSDFASTPSVFSSGLIKDGKITKGENYINLGDWSFKFITEEPMSDRITPGLEIYAMQSMTMFQITPSFSGTNSQIDRIVVSCFEKGNQASVADIATNVACTNYAEIVDLALKNMIQNQAEASPLNTKTNH